MQSRWIHVDQVETRHETATAANSLPNKAENASGQKRIELTFQLWVSPAGMASESLLSSLLVCMARDALLFPSRHIPARSGD